MLVVWGGREREKSWFVCHTRPSWISDDVWSSNSRTVGKERTWVLFLQHEQSNIERKKVDTQEGCFEASMFFSFFDGTFCDSFQENRIRKYRKEEKRTVERVFWTHYSIETFSSSRERERTIFLYASSNFFKHIFFSLSGQRKNCKEVRVVKIAVFSFSAHRRLSRHSLAIDYSRLKTNC